MGLLKALFKRKVAASIVSGEKEPNPGNENIISAFGNISIDEGPPLSAPGSFKPDPNPEVKWGIVGENPFDSMLDISVRSHETVDYTHDDEEAFVVEELGSDGHVTDGSDPIENANSLSVGALSAAPSSELGNRASSASLGINEGAEGAESGVEEQTNGSGSGRTSPNSGDILTAEALAPLQSMVYLTEDGENMADTMSVVSGENSQNLKECAHATYMPTIETDTTSFLLHILILFQSFFYSFSMLSFWKITLLKQ